MATYAELLDAAKENLEALLAGPIEEYQTVEGSGGQKYRYRTLDSCLKAIETLTPLAARESGPRVMQAVIRRPS